MIISEASTLSHPETKSELPDKRLSLCITSHIMIAEARGGDHYQYLS